MPSDRLNANPYDIVIAGHGFMLAEEIDTTGKPTGKKMWNQKRMKYAPATVSPEADPFNITPNYEVPQVFSTWRNGIGERIQPNTASKDNDGVFYTRYCDKLGIYLGPSAAVTAFTPVTTDAVNGGNQFIEFVLSGTRTLFCAMGRYLLQRVSDTSWTVAHDFGSGKKITGLAKYRGSQAAQYMFIAYQDSSGVAQTYVVWDGSSFTSDTNSTKAVDFATYRDEIWLLNQDGDGRWQVQKAIDGGTGATWSGGFVVTDGVESCSNLVIGQDRLYIRSSLGLLGVNAAENDAQQITGDSFKQQFQTLDAARPVMFGQYVVIQTSGATYVYDTQSGGIDPIGVNIYSNNDSIANGIHTTFAPYGQWTMYTWTWNFNNSTAYLWRWGEYERISTLYSPVPYGEMLPSLYGSLYEQSARVNGSIVSAIGGTTPRLYWCDTAGVISFMPISRYGSNPLMDTAVPFNTTNNAEIYLPAITSRNPVERKITTGIGLVTKNSTGANFFTASYRQDQTSVFGGSSNLDSGGTFQAPVSQRDDFTSGTEPVGQWLEIKLTATNTSSSAPPLLQEVVVYQIIRPVMKWVFTATVRIGDNTHSRNGSRRSLMWQETDDRAFIEALGASATVELITPDGELAHVLITDIQIEYEARRNLADPEFYATLEMVEHNLLVSRGTYQLLNLYTYAFLNQYTYAQLKAL